jgi:hypothetical protein
MDIKGDLITFGVFVVRSIISTLMCAKRAWRGEGVVRTRQVKTANYTLYEGDGIPSTVVIDTVDNGTLKKSCVQYSGSKNVEHTESPFTKNTKAPWVWIGYRKLCDETIDLTEQMSEYVVPGNHIRKELIHIVAPNSRFGTLLYVDHKSFGLQELSCEGLVIADDSTTSNVPPCGGVCAAAVSS